MANYAAEVRNALDHVPSEAPQTREFLEGVIADIDKGNADARKIAQSVIDKMVELETQGASDAAPYDVDEAPTSFDGP